MLAHWREISDKATNFDLQTNWLNMQIPYDQILSWLAIGLLGFIAWQMVKFMNKYC